MSPFKTVLCAVITDHIHALPRVLLPIGAALLLFSTVSSFAQTDPATAKPIAIAIRTARIVTQLYRSPKADCSYAGLRLLHLVTWQL